MTWTFWIMCNSFFSGLSVAFGAFGAHALKTRLDSYYLDIFETAVKYQMYHGLALIALAFVATRFDGTWLRACGILMILGILLFSGSLYALVFSGIKMGNGYSNRRSFIGAWCILFVLAFNAWTNPNPRSL